MIRDLQTLLHDALTNNTYDYEDMHNSLDSTLKSSFSYLYFVQKASVEYEELFRYSGEEYTRDFTQVGHLYLDSMNFANFDIDYEFIKVMVTEKFRQSDYYFRFNHLKDFVENPDIFQKIPIVIIDDKVIWDYEIRITKDGATFKLPYRWDFVYEQLRNSQNKMDYVYIYHEIKVLIVDNCFYTRVGDGDSTINKNTVQDYVNSKITIPKSWLNKVKHYDVYSVEDGHYMNRKMTNTEYDRLDGSKETTTMEIKVSLGKTVSANGIKVTEKGEKLFLVPVSQAVPEKEHGIMMCTIHYPTDTVFEYKVPSQSVLDKMIDTKDHPLFDPITADDLKDQIHDIEYETKTKILPKSFEMGTMLIPLSDDGENYVGDLDPYTNDQLRDSTGKIWISCVFIENLHCHTFYTGSQYTTFEERTNENGVDFAVIEKSSGVPYNMPIPVENFMVFKTLKNTGKSIVAKNVDTLEMHYPNIYHINDKSSIGDKYRLFYFYDPNDQLKYTSITDYYFHYIENKLSNYGNLESIINKVYYENLVSPEWTEKQQTEFREVFSNLLNYQYHIYKYGEADFLDRYLSENPDKTPIEYKDETLKEWMKWDPETLHEYVLNQNKLGSSYHLFTNQLDLESRVRYNADIECGYRTKIEVGMTSADPIRFALPVWSLISGDLYYDNYGNVYKYNDTSKYYEKVDSIGLVRLKKMKEDNPTTGRESSINVGPEEGSIYPDSEVSYVAKYTTNIYRWDGNKYKLYTETKNFDEARYVFALNNDAKEFPYLLDLRVFVDGIMVIDCYHERYLYMDYIYIPCDMVTNDSYIELEIFPRYSFKKKIKFNSLNDYSIVTMIEPEEVIFPTLADFYVEDNAGLHPARISPELFDITVITDGKDTAYYDTVQEVDGEPVSETEISKLVSTGEVIPMKQPDGTYVYAAEGNKVYRPTTPRSGVRYYQKYRENVYYYVLKNHYWSKYLLDDGHLIQNKIPESNIDTKQLKKGRAKLYLEAKDIHATEFEDPYPIKFARISMIRISPKSEELVDKDLTFYINKNPQGIPLVVDSAGYPFLEITGKDFNFRKEYLRVFVNGRLLPRSKYDFFWTMYCPRLVIYEWVNRGDFIYMDVTPYRYKEIYYSEELDKDKITIDLKGIITKPFDIRYYDVYMNGRKLSLNNVFSISPWEITLVNLKSQYHLTIYERDRDWEWYGLNYKEDIFAFTPSGLFEKGFVSEEEKNQMIKDIIDKKKDYRLNIVPNEFTEDKMNYNDDFTCATDFFIFYYYELLPKTYLNPDRIQVSTEVMTENFPDVYKAHKTSPYEQEFQDDEQKERRHGYPDVLFLNPDTITKGREVYFDADMNYYKYTENLGVYVYFTKDGKVNWNQTITQAELDQALFDGTLKAGRIVMTYIVGHPDNNIPQEILDESSSIVIPSEENLRKRGV